MGRQPRLDFEGALHHIFPRGNRRERIAHTDRDYRTLERYFIEAARRTKVIPRAWQPMPNHFHALIETPYGNLSEFMQAWLGRYARYYNRVYGKVGHLFQGRFGSRLVQKDAYQKELIRYIHLQRYRAKNPGLIDIFCERYSSHRFYIGETCPPDVAAWIEPMLLLFGETLEEARKSYAQFLADGLKNGKWADFYSAKNGILGDHEFVKNMETRKNERQAVIKRPDWYYQQMVDDLMEMSAELFNVTVSQIISSNQRHDVCRIRQAIAYVGRHMGVPVTQLAVALGRGPSAISKMISLMEDRPLRQIEELRVRLKERNFHA